MPRGVPKLGQALTSSAGDLTDAPEAKVLGTVSAERLKTLLDEPPPPWEVDPKYLKHNTDARRFVDCPENIELRWLNPKQIDVSGWRDWQKVDPQDSRFKLKNKSLKRTDNTIRRGGETGDILAWMYKSWVESRKQVKAEIVRKRTQSAVDRQRQLTEEIRRGHYYKVTMDSAKHPSHTMGEGRTMERD